MRCVPTECGPMTFLSSWNGMLTILTAGEKYYCAKIFLTELFFVSLSLFLCNTFHRNILEKFCTCIWNGLRYALKRSLSKCILPKVLKFAYSKEKNICGKFLPDIKFFLVSTNVRIMHAGAGAVVGRDVSSSVHYRKSYENIYKKKIFPRTFLMDVK